jgi:hypothetical protein
MQKSILLLSNLRTGRFRLSKCAIAPELTKTDLATGLSDAFQRENGPDSAEYLRRRYLNHFGV